MKKSVRFFNFGIRKKVFLLVLVTISSIVAVILWQIGVQSERIALTAAKDSIAQSEIVLEEKIKSRFDGIKETVISLSRDGRVLPLVFDQESQTLQDLSLEFERALNFKSMFITNDRGIILARSDRPEAIGYSMAGRSYLFDEPLQGRVASGFIQSQGSIHQIVTAPIFDNVAKDVVRGTIALSYELSSDLAKDINILTASNISFYIFSYDENRKVDGVANTYSTNPKLESQFEKYFADESHWQKYLSLGKSESDGSFKLNGENFRTVIRPIAKNAGDNLGFILAYRSETELLKPFRQIQKTVLIIGVICLFVVLLFALFIAQRLSKPIINLAAITNDIEKGKYPEDEKVSRNDEIGVLHRALLRMGKGIKDKNELESYLADMAEDIADELKELDVVSNDAGDDEFLGVDNVSEKEKPPVSGDKPAVDKTMLSHRGNKSTQFSVENNTSPTKNIIANRYKLQKILGNGTTGEVYSALDQELGEQVAIKLLFNDYVTNDFATAFKEEIRLARKITHRNILRTFDFGKDEGSYYITMEYVSGFDLGKLIDKRGPQKPHIAIIMVKQICSALSAAHELGIIHRDLKPENMMVNRQGVLKIMDFGLAMQVADKKDKVDVAEASTQETTVAGTPKYMAPEQFIGSELDQRTDIYAVGVILFTLLTGKTPFNAAGIEEIAVQHVSEEPPLLNSLLEDAPADLQLIISRALQKNKVDRYQTIGELLADLNDAKD